MQIRQTRLDNGLTVVSARLAEFESAAITVFVRAGARDETDAESGTAHFLEHMAFKGTARRSALDIATEIECLGAQINAFTSYDMTAYYITGLKDAAADALAILGDVLTGSRFEEADIATERAVIAQETAMRNDDPGSLCSEAFVAAAYPGHPLGRPVIGDPDVVAGMTREMLTGFIGRHYDPARMVVVATGDLSHDWLCDQVGAHFAGIGRGTGDGARTAPSYGGGERVIRRDDFKQVSLMLGFPSVPIDTPGFLDHKLMALALGHGMSSPLFQEVRQKRGLVYYVGAGCNNGPDSGLVVIHAGMTPDNLGAVIEVAGAEVARAREATGERDFMRARNLMLAELASVKERPFQLAMYLASQFFRHGQARGPEQDIASVRAVDIGALAMAARRVFAAAPTLSLVGPVPEGDHLARVRAALG